MPKLSRIILGAFLAAAVAVAMQVGGGGAGPAEALTNCTVSSAGLDSEEQAFLTRINNYRAQNGRSALTVSTNLSRAAAWHANDMATKFYFSHTDSLGRSVGTRVANCDGLPQNGENIAAGTLTDTAAEAFEMWRNSSGHNANMLNGSYRQIGIARVYNANSPYKWYWVTDFSTSIDGTSGGTSSGGSTGGGTTTPPPPTSSPVITKASMTSPSNGATLGTTQTFSWSAVSGAQQYYLYIGTSVGSNNMFGASMGTNTQITLSGFPRTGQTVYVRLWTLNGGSWQYNDYTYRLPR
jgi:uncharacterized protein YkwD